MVALLNLRTAPIVEAVATVLPVRELRSDCLRTQQGHAESGLGARTGRGGGRAGSGWSGVRQSLLLRDELVYPYLLRLLLLARGVGYHPRLLRLPRMQLPLELLVWQARRHPARRGVPHYLRVTGQSC